MRLTRLADTALKALRDVFDGVEADRGIVNQAIDTEGDDFEAAVQIHSAVRADADVWSPATPPAIPRRVRRW